MNYQAIANEVRLMYNEGYAAQYRESDELEVASDNHKWICAMLASITRSFDAEIAVLVLGCGSGRYFHCLQKVRWLVGVDVSLPILFQSRKPVKSQQVQIEKIDLICANIFDLELTPNRFDFIYSMGVLGEHSPFDSYVCNKIFNLLKPGGKALFSVVNVRSKLPFMSWKRRMAETVFPFLPGAARRPLRTRLNSYYMTRSELERIMRRSCFRRYEINLRVSTTSHWVGAHYECLATKAKADPLAPRLR